jgi:hypothetical protein
LEVGDGWYPSPTQTAALLNLVHTISTIRVVT